MKNRRKGFSVDASRKNVAVNFAEKWGKDVDEAVRLALLDLKLEKEQVEITVLEEPTKGFLGLGAKLAKVRVQKKDDSACAESGSAASSVVSASQAAAPQGEAQDGEAVALGEGAKHKVRDYRKNKEDKQNAASSEERPARGRGERSGRGGDRQGRGGGRDRDGRTGRDSRGGRGGRENNRDEQQSQHYVRREWRENRDDFRSGRENDDFAFDPGDVTHAAVSERPEGLVPATGDNAAAIFLKELIEKMGIEVALKTFENPECVYIEIDGKDSRTVIGKRGQTLDAIQYLTNLVMNKEKEKYIRVIVDVEGYRSRRERTLEELASKLAHKVERSGRSVRLEPMNPYERKVIHATLQANSFVTTRSEGDEPYRRVVIEKK